MSAYVLRHGVLPPNPQRRFIGAQDIPLSAVGVAQAKVWAECWKHRPLAGIVSSDLSRCIDTASIIAHHRGIPLYVDSRLREICLGAWQGLTRQEVETAFPHQYAARGEDVAYFRPCGGESFSDLARRVLPAFDYWQARLSTGQGHCDNAPWLLVGHAGTNRAILARHMALPLAHMLDIPQPYACCTRIAHGEEELGMQVCSCRTP